MVESEGVNQYDKTQSFTKLLARSGDIRGIFTKDGWFLQRVMANKLTFYDRYVFATAFAAAGTATSGQMQIRIQDASSKEILYHEEEGTMFEAFMGLSEPWPEVHQFFNGERFGRLQKDLGDPVVQSTTADQFGFDLKGENSLYGKETGYSRFLIPPYQYTSYDIYNPSPKALTLLARWPINKMKVEPLDPSDPEDLKVIIEVLRGRIRKDVWLWAPDITGYPFSHSSVKKVIGVEPLTWNGKEAKVGGKMVWKAGGGQ